MSTLNYLVFFPYEQFRESQETIIKQIEDSARNRKNILLIAPNGAGKTIIALCGLFPLVLERPELKIIYMCRTHAQNARIINELVKISDHLKKTRPDLIVNGLSIRGRNEMCLNQTLLSLNLNPSESMSVCQDLRRNQNCAFFLNLMKKRDDLENPIAIAPEMLKRPVDAEELINFCKEKKICPYYLSKYLLKEMKMIICNYQWILNPFIRESFLEFLGQELQNCVLVFDECHNIIDIATEVNSDRITPYTLRLALKDLEMYRSPILAQSFVRILSEHLDDKKSELKEEEIGLNPKELLENVYKKLGFPSLIQFKNFIRELHNFSETIHEEKLANGEASRDFVGSLAGFWLRYLETYENENYFFCYTISEAHEKKSIALEIVALDPREATIPILRNSYSCLNLSGTLNPFVYNYLIGLNKSGKSYKAIIGESPFKKEHIRALITEGVDTRIENRTPKYFKKMVDKIEEVVYCTPANVGVFCASYKILNELVSHGIESIVQKHDKKLFVEEPGLSATENALLLDNFKSMAKPPNKGGVLLGVCGGRNSEGEDYPGGLMNAVVVVGFPYHLPTPRINAKIKYYDKVFDKQGWNFAYLYPAIQRANQASGRPFRRVIDKGVVVFMDARFKEKINWISEWLRSELEIIPDKKNAIVQQLYPFWHPD